MLSLRPYIRESTFTLCTDYKTLRRLLNTADVSGRSARWCLRLAELKCDVQYRSGASHQLNNGVSKLRINKEDGTLLDDEVPGLGVGEVSLNELYFLAWWDSGENRSENLG